MTLPVRIREHRDTDLAFVVDTWRRSFSAESTLSRFDKDVYFKLVARHIRDLTHEPGATLRIACDEQDEDAIVGFACVTGPELHYVYVRGGKETSMRGHGVARAMLDGLAIASYACRTSAGERRLKPKERGWAYQPRSAQWADGKIRVEMT